jgi:peptide/nickel transport system substrate-binding protein
MPNGGEPFVFDLVAIAEDTYSVDASKLIKGWLEQTGWKVDLLSVSERRALDIWGTSEFDAYVWGWNGRPDPDFMLSIFTTGECGVWSDGCYSDKAYDEMYEAQRLETDLDKRAEIVFQMQDKIYEDVPEVILFYTQDMQAYRKDRWTGFVPQPEPDGSLIFSWGPYSYQQITPLTNPDGTTVISTTSAEGGIPGIAWMGIAAVAGVLLFVVIRRLRRKSDEDQA